MPLSFLKRAALCENIAAKQLCEQIEAKQSNLVLAADVTQARALLTLADQLGPLICLLKTHIDILVDFTPAVIAQLQALAAKHGFLICEDRKFADIGSTAQRQYGEGIYRIAYWADFVTVHTVAGPGTLAGLQASLDQAQIKGRGVFLVGEMSSAGQLACGDYTAASVAMAQDYPALVAGFIGQRRLSQNLGYLQLTPGVHLTHHEAMVSDGLGQQYRDPAQVIQKSGSDLIIVGRAIVSSQNPRAAAELCRSLAWSAYSAGDKSQ